MSDDIKAKFGLQRKRSYLSRDFTDFKTELLSYANTYFKDKIQDFSEASMGGLFLDMAAYVGDNMSFYLDHQFRELNPATAVESKNIESMVLNAGIKISGEAPASVNINFFIDIPKDPYSTIPRPWSDYLPIIKEGAKFKASNGVVFNLTHDLDFNDVNENGDLVAEVIPIKDQVTGATTSFVLNHTGLCVSGQISTQTVSIGEEFVPFRTVTISNPSVSTILRVYDSDGNDYHEVDSLAQDTVYKKNRLSSGDNSIEVITTPYRYVTSTDITSRRTTIRFGSGNGSTILETAIPDPSDLALPLYGKETFTAPSLDPQKLMQNGSLGVSPVSTVITIIYRHGGGLRHNVGAETISQVSEISWKFKNHLGLQYNRVQAIKNGLGIVNYTAASGGAAAPTLTDMKNYITTSRMMQNRIVTTEDLLARIYTMPTDFGVVFRASVVPNPENALSSILYIVSKNNTGKIVSSPDALKQNLSVYLNEFRLIGDAMDVLDGQVINFKIEITCRFAHNVNKLDLISTLINKVKVLFTNDKLALGKPINKSDIQSVVFNEPGVVAVPSVNLVNISGTVENREYSPSKKFLEDDFDLYIAEDYEIFELRYPNYDIEITVL